MIKKLLGMENDGEILGSICSFAGSYAPINYTDCDGKLLPIGNNDYVVQLRVTYDKLFFLVDLYDEDEYGDLEYSSHEVEPSKNILYDNIYEIAGQLGFLLVKGRF